MTIMADKMIHEMAAAFAAGCMDKDNFVQFKEYINAGGALPEGELGELQNIISMLPVILDLENPDPAIKDMVAKKLIGMKEEIKTQILEGKKNTFATKIKEDIPAEPANPPLQNSLSFVSKKDSGSSLNPQSDGKEEKSNSASEDPTPKGIKDAKKTPIEDPRRLDVIPSPSFKKTSPTAEIEEPKIPEKFSSVAGWIALLLTIILFTILGYFTYSSVESINGEMKKLREDVVSLKNELGNANDFITNYTSLIEFFNYKDINVITLTSADVNEKSSARILLSFSQKEALIQFKTVKPLPENKSYQVWSVSKGTVSSLGVYMPKGEEYLKITSFPAVPGEQIESFRITIESKEGASTASETIFLAGTMIAEPVKPRRY